MVYVVHNGIVVVSYPLKYVVHCGIDVVTHPFTVSCIMT